MLRVQVGFCFQDLYLEPSILNISEFPVTGLLKTRSCYRVTQNQILLQGSSKLDFVQGYVKLDHVTGLLKTRSSYRVTQNQILLQGHSKLDLVTGFLNQILLLGYSKLDLVTGLLKLDLVTGLLKTRTSYSTGLLSQNLILLQGLLAKLELVTGLLKTKSCYSIPQNQNLLQGYSKLDLIIGS